MIKRLFLAFIVVLIAATALAQSEMGKSCDNPIPVNKNYVGTITEPGEYWFTAWTYDLPLNVHFTPDVNDAKTPNVFVDFTCEDGVYDDPKLDSIIAAMANFGLELPLEFICDKVTSNGKGIFRPSDRYRHLSQTEGTPPHEHPCPSGQGGERDSAISRSVCCSHGFFQT